MSSNPKTVRTVSRTEATDERSLRTPRKRSYKRELHYQPFKDALKHVQIIPTKER